MDKKRVLLLAPPYMDIYKDIVSCLKQKGYEVIWVKDGQISGNPYNKKNITRHTKTVELYDKEVNSFWQSQFSEWIDLPHFDYFLAIDGLMVSDNFFEELSKRNPSIKKVLFLYDRIEDNYELDRFFCHYDKVFTFDISDSKKYGIFHLPIYWIPTSDNSQVIYDIFGMASFNSIRRYEIFKTVRQLAMEEGLRENIRLWHPHIDNRFLYIIKYTINRMLGKEMLSLSQFDDELFTEEAMAPNIFRMNIVSSKVILDTHTPYQDGLTARFMWALGAGKKIITTNDSAKDYPFYHPDQIFILNNNYRGIIEFVNTPFRISDKYQDIIMRYRIDHWIDTLLY